ncbi:MAG: hypothetical protein GX109_04710 [Bacteroidales bacterium]|nr:hypothetical protein [Bacteroidales bacterium]
MAKYEKSFKGEFNQILNKIHNGILRGSFSASYEDGSDFSVGETRCAVRVYERYSMMGKNRVSLNVTLVGNGDNLHISAVTSGGSQAVFFKINTFGEEAFLDCLRNIIEG